MTPHPEVGNFLEAELAAKGAGSSEYKDPQEFQRRTHITEGLPPVQVSRPPFALMRATSSRSARGRGRLTIGGPRTSSPES